MSNAPHDDNQHRRPHTSPMAASLLEFDLTREVEQLHSEPEWNSGQNAKTLVKYDNFRVVRAQGTCATSRASDKGPDLDPDHRRPYPRASGRSDV